MHESEEAVVILVSMRQQDGGNRRGLVGIQTNHPRKYPFLLKLFWRLALVGTPFKGCAA